MKRRSATDREITPLHGRQLRRHLRIDFREGLARLGGHGTEAAVGGAQPPG